MKKQTIFYLIAPLLASFFIALFFLGFLPQQNPVFGQYCVVDGDCPTSWGSNYCCGDDVCNDILHYFCNYLVSPPGCAPDFTKPTIHIDSCTYGCEFDRCKPPPL